MGFLFRWLFAFLLLAATFNPTEWNYVRWATVNFEAQLPMVLLLGLVLVVGYIVYIRATLRSIGLVGIVLVAAVVGALGWVLYDYGIMTLENRDHNVWLGIFGLSVILFIGLSWSKIRRILTGQVDMDDVDE